MISNPRSVCFVDLEAYPLLGGKNMGFVGGSSVQQVLLAKELEKQTISISFITYDDGGVHSENIGGIKVVKVYKRDNIYTISFLRKTLLIWRALAEVNADIYFHRSGCPGAVSLYCYFAGKRFVRYISSDAEVNKEMFIYLGSLITRIGNWLDIKLANVVIAQTESQRNMLVNNFSKNCYIIKNAFPLSDHQLLPEKDNPPIVLWASTIRAIKQPELFLDLAKELPDVKFLMIGGEELNNASLYNAIKEESSSIPNLNFPGFVPFHEVENYFQRASVFVNTSIYEGFPNTFIQAWMNYTPTVTLNADPDGLIREKRMGFHSQVFDQMVKDVALLIEDKQLREEMGTNGREYVEKNHNISDIAGQYIDVFNRIMLD